MTDDGPQHDSIAPTAFQSITPNGASCLQEILVMGFGLCYVHATLFQLVNHVLEPYINKFVIVYLDDIYIYSESPKQHIEHLRLVLQKLREHRLFIKMPKCYWGRKKLEYLGIIVGNGTLRTTLDKISTVKDWPLPEPQRQIKSFVQLCSYYVKCIHHFSDYAAPLANTCRKNLPGNVVHTKATKTALKR
jgi:hypothetical protein